MRCLTATPRWSLPTAIFISTPTRGRVRAVGGRQGAGGPKGYCIAPARSRQARGRPPQHLKQSEARRISGRFDNTVLPGTPDRRGRRMDGGDRVGIELRRRAAVLAGDERAWREWYDATYDDLRSYAHWRCAGLDQLADEVVQETWLTAVLRTRDFDPYKGSFRSSPSGIAPHSVRNAPP